MGKNGHTLSHSNAAQAKAANGVIPPEYVITIQTRECEVTPELRSHIEDKVKGIERFWARVDETHLKLNCERGRFDAEVTLFSGGIVARGEVRDDNIRAAFDGAVAKIESQLRRHKKKSLDRERKHDNRDGGMSLRNPRETILSGDGLTANGVAPATLDNDEAEINDEVVRVKRFALKPMAPEEAALQMDLLGHNFFVFRDDQNGQTSVVYKRKGGGYGLIETVAD